MSGKYKHKIVRISISAKKKWVENCAVKDLEGLYNFSHGYKASKYKWAHLISIGLPFLCFISAVNPKVLVF